MWTNLLVVQAVNFSGTWHSIFGANYEMTLQFWTPFQYHDVHEYLSSHFRLQFPTLYCMGCAPELI